MEETADSETETITTSHTVTIKQTHTHSQSDKLSITQTHTNNHIDTNSQTLTITETLYFCDTPFLFSLYSLCMPWVYVWESEAPSTQSRFHAETAKVLYGSAFRPHEAGEPADRNLILQKPPLEVVSNLPGFVLDSCGRLKLTETANHDVIATPLDLLANGS